VNFPKGPMTRETLKKDIVITLGGYVAEKMIFGEDMTSAGVYSDMEEASKLANKAIRQYAMGDDPIHISIESSLNEDAFYISQKYHVEAIRIIKTCELEAEALLQKNKLALLKIAEYLTVNSRMEEEMIEKFMKAYAEEAWVRSEGFIKKDDYYKFNSVLQGQLNKIQNASLSFDIERIISEVNIDSVI